MNRIFIFSAFVFFWAALFVTQTYHKLEMHHQLIESQWRQVEYQYHRCSELLPRVCETLDPILGEDLEVLRELQAAGAAYRAVYTQNERHLAAQRIEAALDSLYSSLAHFPSLRSDEDVLSVLERLTVIEREIEVDRRRFDEQSRAYNDLICAAPCSYVASTFGFEQKHLATAKRVATVAQPPFTRMESWVHRVRFYDPELLGGGSGISQ